MKKVVLKLDLHDDKTKQKAMSKVSGLPGVVSVSMVTDNNLAVTGDIDTVVIVKKLRKFCHTEILSVGVDHKKEQEKMKVYPYVPPYYHVRSVEEHPNAYRAHNPHVPTYYRPRSVEEHPNDSGAHNSHVPTYYRPISVEENPNDVSELVKAYKAYNPYMTSNYRVRSMEEDPNATCVIC